MTEYIPKDALVAEINKRIIDAPINYIGHQRVWAYNDVKDIINTLEVKEVDLEKETKRWWKEHLHLNPENKLWMDAHQSVVFAKHFFELGKQYRGE